MTGGAHGGDVAEAVSPLLSAKASAAAAAGYGVRRWRARWRRRGAAACDKGGGGSVRRRCAALLHDEQWHVEGGDEKICQRYVRTQICRTWGGRSANLCFYDRHTRRPRRRLRSTACGSVCGGGGGGGGGGERQYATMAEAVVCGGGVWLFSVTRDGTLRGEMKIYVKDMS